MTIQRDDAQVKGRRTTTAHRFAYELMYGPIPDGLFVCHTCDVRNCVNPWHLWLGTNSDNMEDMRLKGRARSLRGEDNRRALLDEDQVRAIRQAHKSGEATYAELAITYGVSKPTIAAIVTRRTWAWLD